VTASDLSKAQRETGRTGARLAKEHLPQDVAASVPSKALPIEQCLRRSNISDGIPSAEQKVVETMQFRILQVVLGDGDLVLESAYLPLTYTAEHVARAEIERIIDQLTWDPLQRGWDEGAQASWANNAKGERFRFVVESVEP
jgi:hypothetical protein